MGCFKSKYKPQKINVETQKPDILSKQTENRIITETIHVDRLDRVYNVAQKDKIEPLLAIKTIVLGGGCFWGVQHYFRKVPGVVKTKVGYAQGTVKNPTYKIVCNKYVKSGHSEVCKVDYDVNVTSLTILLEHFFMVIDPTTKDIQGYDEGPQYRTGIYYNDPSDATIINDYINSIKEDFDNPIVVEVLPAETFWDAEEYHQDYLEKNPGGYCHINGSQIKCLEEIDVKARKGRLNKEDKQKYRH